MHALWLLIVLLFSGIFELLIGNYGINVPLLALAGFYFAVLYPWPLLLPYFCLIGLWLDLCSPINLPAHTLTMLIVIPIGHNWRYFGDFSSKLGRCLPGAAVGALCGIMSMIRVIDAYGLSLSSIRLLRMPLEQMLLCALVFPVASMLWDGIAYHLGVRRLANVNPYDSRWDEHAKDIIDDD